MKILALVLLFLVAPLRSETLDYILAVFDDSILTKQDLDRVKNSLKARNEISPQIYSSPNYDTQELVKIFINKRLIRDKLNNLGYVITDDQVEAQIKTTEERLGLNREALLTFLKSNQIEFEEYFELTRESIEYNIFISRIIAPMINITEQEIKNEYFKFNEKNSTISYKYTLIDFILPKNKVTKDVENSFADYLKELQQGKSARENFPEPTSNIITDITEDGMAKEIRQALQGASINDFSNVVTLGGFIHVFFVKNKEMIDSDNFLKQKESLRQKIFSDNEKQVTKLWLQREESKHYIKTFNNDNN